MKKVISRLKLRVLAGKVSPSPSIASSLGPKGVNLMQFCKKCNDATASCKPGELLRIVVKLFDDKSFDIFVKGSALTDVLKSVANVKVCAKNPGKEIVGGITSKQLHEIANDHLQYTNANSLSAVLKMLNGTAKSMGLRVEAD